MQKSIGCNKQTTRETTKMTANEELNDMNDKKEMAVGQSKSKLSWKINKWSRNTINEDDIPPDQQRGAAATTNKDKLVPPLLDNGEGKQQISVIDHKSNIDKCNDKDEKTNKPATNNMASVIGQSHGLVAEANYQASPPNQCGKTHNQSPSPTPKGAATLINGACPALTKPHKELSNWTNGGPPPTVKIPKEDETSQEVIMNMDG
jgi:hypothetical protein